MNQTYYKSEDKISLVNFFLFILRMLSKRNVDKKSNLKNTFNLF